MNTDSYDHNHHFEYNDSTGSVRSSFTRRAFLQKGLTLVSAAATIPHFLQRSAFAMNNPFDQMLTSSIAGVPDDHILVVIQLAGGNDGLNTVVPYGMDQYYRARPQLGIRPNDVLRLKDQPGLGFHTNLTGFKELYESGLLACVQAVGYPNPNRSHFTSTDIWSTANPQRPQGEGWLGRYFDNACNGTPQPDAAVAIGATAPKALTGRINRPVSFESAEMFQWIGDEVHPSLAKPYEALNQEGIEDANAKKESQLSFLTRTALDAQVASEQIRNAVALDPLVQYPGNRLAQQLRIVGSMIRAKLPTRVYYVSLGGFDTHAGEAGAHANLMTQLGSSILAFQNDLKAQGNDGRVLTMTFSEFGRRVNQNASVGTDHGTAAPMFLFGPMVKAGFHGNHPSLTDLDKGDLKFRVDFRSVYAAVLEDWLGADSRKVLKGSFRPASIIRNG